MANRRNDKQAKLMYEYYLDGYSLQDVGKAFGVTRQAVYAMFKLRGWGLRRNLRPLKHILFNGNKYTLRNHGYYSKTTGNRSLLHRDVWEFHNGKIPPSHDIHHINRDKSNNKISNLELYAKSEHARKFNTGKNQYSKDGKYKIKEKENG